MQLHVVEGWFPNLSKISTKIAKIIFCNLHWSVMALAITLTLTYNEQSCQQLLFQLIFPNAILHIMPFTGVWSLKIAYSNTWISFFEQWLIVPGNTMMPMKDSRIKKGPGNMTLQIVRTCERGKLSDQGARPALKRQSRERAERDSLSCLDQLSLTRNWPLQCKDNLE